MATIELPGIDVSKWNGVINWSQVVSSGVKFAMIRAATGSRSGNINIDPKLIANVNGAHSAGIAVGLYLYSYAYTINAAQKEAENLIKAIGSIKDKITWPIAYDLEEPGQATYNRKSTNTEQARVFCDTIRKAGFIPILYSNPNWLYNYIDVKAIDVDIWLAHYTYVPGKTMYKGDKTIHQYSNKGSIPGIKGDVDLNMAFKDYSAATVPDYEAAINKLYSKGQINSPAYWIQVCEGKTKPSPNNIQSLFIKWANSIK